MLVQLLPRLLVSKRESEIFGETEFQARDVVHRVLLHKYYVDELYDAVFVEGPVMGKSLGTALSTFDQNVVDGGVNGAGWLTLLTSRASIFWDTWIVDGLVNLLAIVTRALSLPVRLLQTGFVQGYALLIVLGVLTFVGYYLLH